MIGIVCERVGISWLDLVLCGERGGEVEIMDEVRCEVL